MKNMTLGEYVLIPMATYEKLKQQLEGESHEKSKQPKNKKEDIAGRAPNILREIRTSAGLNQTELGKLSGYRASYISMLESKRDIPAKTLAKLKKVIAAHKKQKKLASSSYSEW